jgi:replication factor A1
MYRLSLIGTDGTATAEFTLFGRVARQVIGKPVVSLMRSASKSQYGSVSFEPEHMLPDIAALVSQKFTFSVY